MVWGVQIRNGCRGQRLDIDQFFPDVVNNVHSNFIPPPPVAPPLNWDRHQTRMAVARRHRRGIGTGIAGDTKLALHNARHAATDDSLATERAGSSPIHIRKGSESLVAKGAYDEYVACILGRDMATTREPMPAGQVRCEGRVCDGWHAHCCRSRQWFQSPH